MTTGLPTPSPDSGLPLSAYRYLDQVPDPDGAEVQEWVDSVDALVETEGHARARRLLLQVRRRAEERGVDQACGRWRRRWSSALVS